MKPISVFELTSSLKMLIESGGFDDVVVRGELSNFKLHGSGHMYFTLKDEQSEVRCVMFRGDRVGCDFAPKDGLSVIARGCVRVYVKGGSYQLYVKEMKRDGFGALYQKFLELKEKLEKEGLFSEVHKKPLPRYPRVIGVVTSPTGAAIRDIINTIGRRWPVEVRHVHAVVQGDAGGDSVVSGIRRLDAMDEVDVIIVGRGGGSIEDLWNFNEEKVVRAVFACRKPVVSAVGHETDFTLCDFVADVRAPTPTGAAEMATPNIDEVRQTLDVLGIRLKRNLQNYADQNKQRVDELVNRMELILAGMLREKRQMLDGYAGIMSALGPEKVLERGYSITLKEGRVVNNADVLKKGDELITIFKKGRIKSKVDNGL